MAVYQSRGPRGWNLGEARQTGLARMRAEMERRKQETWQEYLQLKEQHPGLTRTQLYALNKALYARMSRYSQIEYVPRKINSLETALERYRALMKENPNMTRGELEKRDHAVYELLRKRGKLKNNRIFPEGYDRQDRKYRKKYDGMTMIEIDSIDPEFARQLRELRLSLYVPNGRKNGNGKKPHVNSESKARIPELSYA